MSNDFDDVTDELQDTRAPSAGLALAVEKGRKKLLAGLVSGVTIGALTSSAGVFVLYRDHDPRAAVFAAMQIGVPLAVLGFVAYSQRHAWRATSETMRGFLALELERHRDWIRRMRFLRWTLLPLVGLVVLFQALLVQKHPGLLSWHPVAVVALGGPYAIAAWLSWHSLRRQAGLEREEGELMKKLAELDDVGR
jgi:hypothetical protein